MTNELEKKIKQMDDSLRGIYVEVAGDIRNCANSITSFIEECVYTEEKLPEKLIDKASSAYRAMKQFVEANEKITEILDRLPKGKIHEYYVYHCDNTSPENPIHVDYEILDNVLRDLYIEICGPIRNDGGSMICFVEVCQDGRFGKIPEYLKNAAKAAKKASDEFMASNNRISDAMDKLPEGKTREYDEYIAANQTNPYKPLSAPF